MLLDWPTVIFQIINFLILIALLKRFLYGPIIKAMDEREQTVAARLADAAKTEKIAVERAAELAREQEKFAGAREEMVQQAKEEVEGLKNNALRRLQDEVDAKRQSWKSVLASEQTSFLQKLKIIINRNVFLIARKALADLADEELEGRLVEKFIGKIGQKEEGLDALLSSATAEISCITGFPLSEAQQQQLEMAIKPLVHEGSQMSFQHDRDLGFGLQLFSEDQKWEWNLNRYMLELETEIDTAVRALSGVSHGQKDHSRPVS